MNDVALTGGTPPALIVVDMQNSYCLDTGITTRVRGMVPGMPFLVTRTAALVESLRAQGCPVIFTRHCYQYDYADAERGWKANAQGVMALGGLRLGTFDSGVAEAVGSRTTDYFIDKARPDAFVNTSLELLLRGLGVDRLIVAGVLTNVCVQGTTVGARQREFDVTVVEDCTAARSVRLHEGAISNLVTNYGVSLSSLSQMTSDAWRLHESQQS